MANSISAISIAFGMDASKLDSGIRNVSGSLKSGIGAAVTGISGKLATLLVGGLSIGAVTVAFNRMSDTIDTLSKSASRLGIAIGQLQALRFAADLAGVSAEELDKNLTLMTKNIAVAASTGKGAADDLAALGLSAKELAALPVDQQFAKIAEAINKIPDAGTRAAAAMAIFGKGGIGMLSAFGDASEQIARTNALLDEWGVKLTGADGKAVEAMNDSWTELITLITAAGQKLVAQIAPTIQAIWQTLQELLKPTAGWADYTEEIADWLAWAAAQAANMISILVGGWRVVRGVSDLWRHGVEMGIQYIRKAWKEFVGESTTDIVKRIKELYELAGRDVTVLNRGIEDMQRGLSGDVGNEFLDRVERNKREAEAAASAINDTGITDAMNNFANAAKELKPEALLQGTAAAQSAINADKKYMAMPIVNAVKEGNALAREGLAVMRELVRAVKPPIQAAAL